VDLAEEAPATVAAGSDLWQAGVRRHRRRRVAAVATTTAVLLVVGVLGSLRPLAAPSPEPAEVPASELHLPRTVHRPSPWAESTRDTGPPGPLAVLSLAHRNLPDGFTGTQQTAEPYGVSALDGSAVFLDLPGGRTEEGYQLGYGALALSPNGRKVGFSHFEQAPGAEFPHVIGWDVYDTVSGEITELRVPGMPEIRGIDAFEMRFTGDSRYLLTNYSPTGSDGSRKDALVAWDVETGERVVVEGTGYYWLAEPGSAPEGVVWSRDRRIFTFHPGTGQTEVATMPNEVVTASFGPDGRALAYVGHRPSRPNEAVPWHLYVGESVDDLARVRLDVEPGQLLGWRSVHEVVVGGHRRGVQFVDVRTGEHHTAPAPGWSGEEMIMSPLYAADLWRNPLVAGVEPPAAPDPRWWLRPPLWVASALLGLAGLLVVRRRRARA
jgi:hypothetical protein